MNCTSRRGAARSRVALTISTACALALTGCVNPAFRASTASFGQLTKATVTAQNTELAALVAAERERIRAELARSRADLRLSGDCPQVMNQRPDTTKPPCTFHRLVGGQRVPIEEAAQYDNILALSAALSNYADSLATLAGDFSASETAFTTSVTGVATSIGGIDRVIRQVTGAEDSNLNAKLGAIAGLVARLGNLYFAHERNRVLKQIIIEGDDFVQTAARLLTAADQSQRLYQGNRLYAELNDAQNEASRIAHDARNGSESELRAAQDVLFERLATYNRIRADMPRFAAIAAAHAKLRQAAEGNLSAAELREAIRALIDLAGAAHQTVTTLQQANRSSDNATEN